MPTYQLHGNLVHFAAFKHPIEFYLTQTVFEAFQDALAPYQHAKGSIRFLVDQSIRYDLIRKIVKFWEEENLEKAQKKGG